ncbi:MAG: aspartate dehydrogenase [Rhodospirillaceae bacterium]|nr:aspartate dehydrogenase [Rhodospirillaceae bacterium]MBT5512977.1 aspartate dehydrogenase [Rhodospirillaceae bacterium]MBT6085859.1 aspartate dehydrogenase [Rhodospirillaceae bacterium]MBT6885462.1 aspartate dehydrogenase [Rhodospirillaceae bacterium]
MSGKNLKVGVAGLGAIGMPVARWLDGGVERLSLSGVSAGKKERAARRVSDFKTPPVVSDLAKLVAASDVLVEALPPDQFLGLAEPTVAAGKTLIVLTLTSLLTRMDLVETARETGAQIICATGALVGFDAVRAAAKGEVTSITMKTRKPPEGLKKATFVVEQGINLDDLSEPLCLYSGSVRDAAAKFPANVNVAVALALAGIGVDRTEYEIWADPAMQRNTHVINVDADSTSFELTIAGVPTEENPATGKLTPLSVMATLERLVAPLTVGT